MIPPIPDFPNPAMVMGSIPQNRGLKSDFSVHFSKKLDNFCDIGPPVT